MQAAENERAVIEAYLEEHQLDAALNDAVNAIVKVSACEGPTAQPSGRAFPVD
jgi:hypothetical protein